MSNHLNMESLVERFTSQLETYQRPNYNETQTRIDFINPLFMALGWDVNNEQGLTEAYRPVVHEEALRVGRATKMPDYSFRVGGIRKFFVEAKKPAVNLKTDPEPAFQVRRYGWNAKLSLSIVTNFAELAVYDCRLKPNKNDKASTARLWYLRYTDYLKEWEKLAEYFSFDAVWHGSLEKYLTQQTTPKGILTVDAAFLSEIEGWRERLARNITAQNPHLTSRQINFAVQQTIDRIIFLRICEDRGIEDYGRLLTLTNGPQIYPRLFQLFHQADERYNSGLFHFKAETKRGDPDSLTPTLRIDDAELTAILKNLYYPDSPYEFSVFPADILGQVYEQFLGKVIRLTDTREAVIEEKPEVKKAGGVYYTPTYIVDYIVKQTIGKLVEGKTVEAVSHLTLLDPACGSGSFLLGAYQFLLSWHLEQYLSSPEKWAKGKKPRLYQARGGLWKLTTTERKRILLNNIYGVDIDTQAVEVTKLSLLLKVLEDEQSVISQLSLFRERVLPDLENNIKCGNSLIGNDFYLGQQPDLLDEETFYRVNAFDWEKGFAGVMKTGGFEAVIGNPPYGFHQIHSQEIKPYFKEHFVSSQGSFEHYFLFYEKSLKLLKSNGLHGFIVPVTWLTIPSAKSLRKFILSNFWVKEICWLPELVFVNAKVNTLISIMENSKPAAVKVSIHDQLGLQSPPKTKHSYQQSQFIKADYFIGIFEQEEDHKIIQKMVECSQMLAEVARPCSGYNPYEVGKGEAPKGGVQTEETVKTKPYHAKRKLGKAWKPEIVGRDISRYHVNFTGKRWVKYGPWLTAPRDPDNFGGKRILVQEITGGQLKRIIAGYFEDELYHSRDVIPIKIETEFPHPFYLLGLLNSKLFTWYHHKRNPKAQKGLFPKVLVSDLKKLPIRIIDCHNPIDQATHDYLVKLVTQMLDLNKRLATALDPHGKTVLTRQMEAVDDEIDKVVYGLYNLTEEEIKFLESPE